MTRDTDAWSLRYKAPCQVLLSVATRVLFLFGSITGILVTEQDLLLSGTYSFIGVTLVRPKGWHLIKRGGLVTLVRHARGINF